MDVSRSHACAAAQTQERNESVPLPALRERGASERRATTSTPTSTASSKKEKRKKATRASPLAPPRRARAERGAYVCEREALRRGRRERRRERRREELLQLQPVAKRKERNFDQGETSWTRFKKGTRSIECKRASPALSLRESPLSVSSSPFLSPLSSRTPEGRALLLRRVPSAPSRATQRERGRDRRAKKNSRRRSSKMANSGGFSFDLCSRNAVLEQRGVVAPRLKKTGTTIVGLVYKVGRVREVEREKASMERSIE